MSLLNRRISLLILTLVSAAPLACGSNPTHGLATGDSGLGGDDGGATTSTTSDTGGGFTLDSDLDTGTPATVSVIYAHTDDTLWKLDPTTKNVTMIGAFTFPGGTGEQITDMAVKGDGTVYVNSTGNLYKAALPAGGTGSVALSKIGPLGDGGTKFYALGFTPAGFLGAEESLIAGDGNGDLYLVSLPSGSASKVGGFGPCVAGDPSPCGSASGQFWALSGDVVFYNDSAGTTRGLATLRACKPGSRSPTCDDTNDALAEIDMTALKARSPSSNLRKQILGTGSGYGRLFGIGAWDANVYAFTRFSSSSTTGETAQLVQIDVSGKGTSLKTFGTINSGPCAYDSAATCSGWSGAGVSSKVKVTIIK